MLRCFVENGIDVCSFQIFKFGTMLLFDLVSNLNETIIYFLIAKAKTAESAEKLFEIAKENGVELTAEEAKTYFAQLNANGAV